MFQTKGFFTKKLIVGTVTLLMMLYLDIMCHVWDGMGMILLIMLTLYVVANYMIRYVEMKKEEERKKKEGKELAEEGGANNPAEMEYDIEENESIEAEVSENSGDSTLDE